MIQILNGRETELDKIADDYYEFHEKHVKDKIDCYLGKPEIHDDQKKVLKDFRKRLPSILKGKPAILKSEVEFFHKKYSLQLVYMKSVIEDIFNYSRDFVQKYDESEMGAYTVAKRLKMSVCPYCNRQYIHTYDNVGGRGRTRPQFDHFYDKATFPYLAISFYNLVPSCSICNSSLKGTVAFTLDTHLHPYVKGFEDEVQFSVQFIHVSGQDIDYTKLWNGDTDCFEIDFKHNKKETEDNKIAELAEGNIDTFKLKPLYQNHKDHVVEMLVKSKYYNEEQIRALVKTFPDLFRGKDEIMRFIFGNYTSTLDLDKRPLSKLTRDICQEFGICF